MLHVNVIVNEKPHLSVVTPVHGHSLVPEVFEEGGQNLLLDVLGFHTVRGTALLDHFQHNFLHLFIWRLELSHEDQHHFSRVVVGILCVHEGNEVTNGLQEGGQTLQPIQYGLVTANNRLGLELYLGQNPKCHLVKSYNYLQEKSVT